ncbi:MAG: EamA/RhaT family transporter [Caldilinea sp. CFX5]|nr:EamA/RhaT family transporter [Caldilinea sp. CFX5]
MTQSKAHTVSSPSYPDLLPRILGILLVAGSAAAFGTLAIFGRYAYAAGLDAITILFLRFSLAALVLLALLLIRREPLPRGRSVAPLIGMGAIGYVGQAFCYLTALNYASSGLVALLLYLYPAFVTVLSVVVLHERMTRLKLLALLLALVGTGLTIGPAGGQLLGILLALGAAGIYSIYIIVGAQVMKQVSAVQSSTVIMASAGAMAGLLMLINGPHWPVTAAGWWAVAGIVLVATVLPAMTFLIGLRRVGPTTAAMISTLEPVVTVLLAAWLEAERLQPLTLIGGGLILGAVLLLTQSELRRRAG